MASRDEEKRPLIPPDNTGYGVSDTGDNNASASTSSTGGLLAQKTRPEQIHHPRVGSSSGFALLPKALVIENKGSTARDFCAVERNFLAWVRLSTMLIITGLSIFFHFALILPDQNQKPDQKPISKNLPSTIISIVLVFSGFVVLLWAFVQFFYFHSVLVGGVVTMEHGKWSFCVVLTVGVIIYVALVIEEIRLGEESDSEPAQFRNFTSTLLSGLF